MKNEELVDRAVETPRTDVLAVDDAVAGTGPVDDNREGTFHQDGEFAIEPADPKLQPEVAEEAEG